MSTKPNLILLYAKPAMQFNASVYSCFHIDSLYNSSSFKIKFANRSYSGTNQPMQFSFLVSAYKSFSKVANAVPTNFNKAFLPTWYSKSARTTPSKSTCTCKSIHFQSVCSISLSTGLGQYFQTRLVRCRQLEQRPSITKSPLHCTVFSSVVTVASPGVP